MTETTEYVWSDLRDRMIERVGDAPSQAIEQRIIEVFTQQPKLVEAGMEHVGARFDRGVIRSPWPILAKHVEEAVAAQGKSLSIRANDSGGRMRAIARAEQWMRAAGVHFNRENEVEDELFGDRGPLRGYSGDAELVEQMLALWRAERPRGVQVEREADERAWRYRESRKPKPVPAIRNPFLDDDE